MGPHYLYHWVVELPAQEALSGTIKAEGSRFFKQRFIEKADGKCFRSREIESFNLLQWDLGRS